MAASRRLFTAVTLAALAAVSLPAHAGAPPRIDLDVENAAISNVLRLIAATAHLNLVVSDAVKGKVTLHLRNVPWRLALRVVVRSKGFAVRRTGNVLRVDTPKAFAREDAEAVHARQRARALAPRRVTLIPVNYASAASLAPKVKAVLGDHDKVDVDTRTNTLVVVTGGR